MRAPWYKIDEYHVKPAGAPLAPKDDAMACMASSLNTPLTLTYIDLNLCLWSKYELKTATNAQKVLDMMGHQISGVVGNMAVNEIL